jgi:hypothetical protein
MSLDRKLGLDKPASVEPPARTRIAV